MSLVPFPAAAVQLGPFTVPNKGAQLSLRVVQ